jgi:Tol biopolymer transport system component
LSRPSASSVSFNAAQGTVGKPISITEGSMKLWFADPSPDGEWLTAYSMGQQRHVFVMRTDGTDQRDLTPGEYRSDQDVDIGSPAISHDNRTIYLRTWQRKPTSG